jgi:hypothetical protein
MHALVPQAGPSARLENRVPARLMDAGLPHRGGGGARVRRMILRAAVAALVVGAAFAAGCVVGAAAVLDEMLVEPDQRRHRADSQGVGKVVVSGC